MTNKLFLDTETTGFKPGQIAQLSYIITDSALKFKGAVNQFFLVDEMPKQASDVHGFTMERLSELSGGTRFQDRASELVVDFKDSDLVIHNSQFDMNFLHTEFMRCKLQIEPKSTFCTMKHFTPICKIPGRFGNKWPKLEELMKFLGIEPEVALAMAREFYGAGDIGFHDARFDTAGLFLCYKQGMMGKFID
jgi:DNA polymerase III epsilon subunit-like protein